MTTRRVERAILPYARPASASLTADELGELPALVRSLAAMRTAVIAIAAIAVPFLGLDRDATIQIELGIVTLLLPWNLALVLLYRRVRDIPIWLETVEVVLLLTALGTVSVPVWAAMQPTLLVPLALAALAHRGRGIAITLGSALIGTTVCAAILGAGAVLTGLVLTALAASGVAVGLTIVAATGRLRRALETLGEFESGMDALMWEADAATGRFTHISGRAEEIFGYPKQMWLTNHEMCRTYIHPDDVARIWITVDDKNLPSAPIVREYRGRTADGRWLWLRDSVTVFRTRDGKVRLRGLMVDISAEKDHEIQIRQFADIVNRIDVGLLVFDPTPSGLILTRVNPAIWSMVKSIDPPASAHDPVADLAALTEVVDPWLSSSGYRELLEQVAVNGRQKGFNGTRFCPEHFDDRVFDVDIFALPGGMSALSLTDVTEQHQAWEALEHQAMHDFLTGLPNRMLLQSRLASALAVCERTGEEVALLLLDLDQFKEVNDTLGHQRGDELLCEVSNRLQHVLRKSDTVARLGGDEFAVLLTTNVAEASLPTVAKKIEDAINTPIRLGEVDVQTGVSIGIALAPGHGVDGELLMQHADVAMYQAKRAGGGWRLYAAASDHNTLRRLTLVGDLAGAAARGEMSVHYHPKLDISTNRLVGLEALARWDHPKLGSIAPGEFIELADLSGAINTITRFVLEESVTQTTQWRAEGHDLELAVNLSVRNLYDREFVGWLDDLLWEKKFPPNRLILEITERDVMEDVELATAVLGRLAQTGVRASIDDFGTGYSSLARLLELPVREVKIDRSFVGTMADREASDVIVRSIIDLARNLGLAVVAEGVEDRWTLERLQELGCTLVQGFLLARPQPADEMTEWLTDRRAGNPAKRLAF